MIVRNKYIPVKGFCAMAIWPIIFYRIGAKQKPTTENHERIHFAQQKELFLIGFYLLYLYYWLKKGYKKIPFEREAYLHQRDEQYLLNRKPFAWRRYS